MCALGCGVTACAPIPTLAIDNEAGVSISLHVDGRNGTLGWQDKVVVLRPGERRVFRVGADFLNGKVATLGTGGCDYRYEPVRYDLPADFQPAHLAAVLVRIDIDGAPYLVPVARGWDVNGQRQFQTLESHAVRPVSRACEPATPPS